MKKGKIKELFEHLELLTDSSENRKVEGFDLSSKELMRKFILEAKELVEYNEYGIALENLLENLYEIDFKLDSKAIELINDALKSSGLNFEELDFIEKLLK